MRKVSLQFWHNFEDDKRRLLDIVYTPHYEKGRTPKTVAAYVERTRDITDIAKLEEQLRQSCKLETIGMLTGSIAHDFNNILSAILGVFRNFTSNGGRQFRTSRLSETHSQCQQQGIQSGQADSQFQSQGRTGREARSDQAYR